MLWTTLTVLLALGLLLLVRGLIGRRIDDHPICRRCSFDLVGQRDRTGPCPECGANLGTVRAVRIGHRRRHRGAIVLGVTLLLGAGVAGGIIAGNARGMNWNTWKPEWWLASDVRSGDPELFDRAMEEFTLRLRDGRLSLPRARALLAMSLDLHEDRSARWSTPTGDFLEAARISTLMSPDEISRYVRNTVNISIQPAAKIQQGAQLVLQFAVGRRITGMSLLAVQMQTSLLEVNSAPVEDDAQRIWAVYGGGNPLVVDGLSHPAIMALDPGEHTIKIRGHIGVGDEMGDPLYFWDEEFTMHATVAPALEPVDDGGLERFVDESLREGMQQAIQIRGLRLEGNEVSMSGAGSVLIQKPPAAAAFEIYWRYTESTSGEQREVRMGTTSMTAGMFGGSMFGALLPPEFAHAPPEKIDVVLRPDPAPTDTRLVRIWNSELVYPDLPLKRPEPETEVPQK